MHYATNFLEARWVCTVNSIDLVRIKISIPVNNIPSFCNGVSAKNISTLLHGKRDIFKGQGFVSEVHISSSLVWEINLDYSSSLL